MTAMKYMVLLSAFAALLFGAGCRVSDVREMTVHIPALADDADVQRVRAALAPLNGVNKEQAVFDIQGKKVVLTYDSMVIAKKNIEIAIAEAGYDANGIQAIKPATAK